MLTQRLLFTRAASSIAALGLLLTTITAGAVKAEEAPPSTLPGGLVVPTTVPLTLPPLNPDVLKQMNQMSTSYQSAQEAMLKVYSGQAGVNAQALSMGVSIDSTVQAAGRAWADELAKFRAKSVLGTPTLDPEWEAVSVKLGEMTSKATASMAAVAPMSFTSLRAGTGTPTDKQLWAEALKSAGMSAKTTVPSTDPCMAAMMAAASGADSKTAQAAGKGCKGLTACVASGMYFNKQLQGVASGGSVEQGVLPPADFNQLQPWQRDAIAGAAPSVTGSAPTTGGTTCGTSSAVSGTANKVVPRAWDAIGGKNGAAPRGWSGIGG